MTAFWAGVAAAAPVAFVAGVAVGLFVFICIQIAAIHFGH